MNLILDNEIILSTNYEYGFIIKEKLSDRKSKITN